MTEGRATGRFKAWCPQRRHALGEYPKGLWPRSGIRGDRRQGMDRLAKKPMTSELAVLPQGLRQAWTE